MRADLDLDVLVPAWRVWVEADSVARVIEAGADAEGEGDAATRPARGAVQQKLDSDLQVRRVDVTRHLLQRKSK